MLTIGGVIFRDEAPVLYADRVGPFTLDESHRAENTTLDRFGLFKYQVGGHHVELYLGDLRYTR